MAAYILFGIEARHLLTAVIMTAPGTLMMAKMFVPETELPETMGTVKLDVERTDVNVIDAAGRGTGEGLHLAMNVAAMLISFLSLVALLNALLGLAGLSLQQILAGRSRRWRGRWACRGGMPRLSATCSHAHGAHEFVAYSQLGPLKASLDPNSFTIATFALCGFANFSSIGIQIGGIGALAPNRRPTWPASGCGRCWPDAGQLHDGDDRGVPAMSDEYARVQAAAAFVRARVRRRRRSHRAGSGLGDSRRMSAMRP